MTEDQIEIATEKLYDKLDKEYMRGQITREEYEKECKYVERWAEEKYKKVASW